MQSRCPRLSIGEPGCAKVFQAVYRELAGIVGGKRAGPKAPVDLADLNGAGKSWHRFVAKLGFGHGSCSGRSPGKTGPETRNGTSVELFLSLPGRWRALRRGFER